MANYKELYLKIVRASESAIHTLIAAQQECEELYITSQETESKKETISVMEKASGE